MLPAAAAAGEHKYYINPNAKPCQEAAKRVAVGGDVWLRLEPCGTTAHPGDMCLLLVLLLVAPQSGYGQAGIDVDTVSLAQLSSAAIRRVGRHRCSG